MLWRSVVGKVWFTILLLVSVVLTILMMLLLQSFERFNLNQAESQLANHATMIASIIDGNHSSDGAIQSITQYSSALNIDMIVFDGGEIIYSTTPFATAEPILENEELMKVFIGDKVVKTEGDFQLSYEDQAPHEMMVVGVPLMTDELVTGAVFVYQSLSAIQETLDETRQIIYFSAGVALVLTTFFAFFLSTRISAPLFKMRQVALEIAEGKFDTKIPVISYDEIGQLSIAINRMGRDLQANIDELNQEKEQLARILGSMADGVITLDKFGQVVLTNPPAEQFLQSWMYEQKMSPVMEKANLPNEITTLFKKVVLLEEEAVIEFEMQGRSWAILMTPLHDPETVRGAVAVFRDMTEERRHDKLRKDFIANVSHELRTPIAMLQGYSEAIIDGIASSDAEKKEIAQIIYEESLRMGRLVNELLDIARIEAGHVELNRDTVDIESFIDRIVRKFQGLAREKNIDLTYELDATVADLNFDSDRIEQVLTNLVHNAIHHTDEEGRVFLHVVNDEKGCKFNITDTGKGIPEEDLPYVFERFYKADKARTRGQGGTGLGLSIAKNIVDAHKGSISVHSKMNEGTTFSFYLPRNI